MCTYELFLIRRCIVHKTFAGCAGPDSPLVAADMRDQLEWVRQITGNCNEKTCHKQGKCIEKENLLLAEEEKNGEGKE